MLVSWFYYCPQGLDNVYAKNSVFCNWLEGGWSVNLGPTSLRSENIC